jgi:tetratricopeptide (TPR) repeat protein
MKNKPKLYFFLFPSLAILLASPFISCGQTPSEAYTEGDEADLAQSEAEATIPTSETPIPDATPTPDFTDESKAHLEQGNIYLEQEKWHEAIYEYSQAIELTPDIAEAYANRALARFRQLEYNLAAGNEYNLVIADCGMAIEFNYQGEIDFVLARAYVRRGDYHFEHALSESDYNKAIADYTAAMKLDPLIESRTPADVYYERGKQHLENRNFTQAIEDFNKAIQLDKHMNLELELAEAYQSRGYDHYKHGGFPFDEAIADYIMAIELDTNNARYYQGRAYIYGTLADVYRDHGEVSKEADSKHKAIVDYRKALELSEDDLLREQILQNIDKLEATQAIEDLAYIKTLVLPYSDDADPDYEGISIHISYYDTKSEAITPSGVFIDFTVELHYWGSNRPPFYQNRFTVEYPYYSDPLFPLFPFPEELVKIPYSDIPIKPSLNSKLTLVLIMDTPGQGEFRVQDTILLWP